MWLTQFSDWEVHEMSCLQEAVNLFPDLISGIPLICPFQICSKFTFPRLSIYLPSREFHWLHVEKNKSFTAGHGLIFFSFFSFFVLVLNVLSAMRSFSCSRVNKVCVREDFVVHWSCFFWVTTSTAAEFFKSKVKKSISTVTRWWQGSQQSSVWKKTHCILVYEFW